MKIFSSNKHSSFLFLLDLTASQLAILLIYLKKMRINRYIISLYMYFILPHLFMCEVISPSLKFKFRANFFLPRISSISVRFWNLLMNKRHYYWYLFLKKKQAMINDIRMRMLRNVVVPLIIERMKIELDESILL